MSFGESRIHIRLLDIPPAESTDRAQGVNVIVGFSGSNAVTPVGREELGFGTHYMRGRATIPRMRQMPRLKPRTTKPRLRKTLPRKTQLRKL